MVGEETESKYELCHLHRDKTVEKGLKRNVVDRMWKRKKLKELQRAYIIELYYTIINLYKCIPSKLNGPQRAKYNVYNTIALSAEPPSLTPSLAWSSSTACGGT